MSVAAIVVNWRGWRDTIECLESLLRADPAPALVVVVDNASGDGSLDRVREWAAGDLPAPLADDPALRRLTDPPLPKPITLVERGTVASETGMRLPVERYRTEARPGAMAAEPAVAGDGPSRPPELVMLGTDRNLGYAGGNNVGIRFALAREEIDAVWILNNDTVVARDALGELVREMEAVPGAGMCGSTLLHYARPSIVQTLGGASYNRWLALPKHIGEGEPLVRAPAPARVRARLDYVNGASMLVTRRFIEDVGLMDESYFLYFEELDWCLRARGRYGLAFAPGSIVFHKEGRSIGTSGRHRKSELSDRWFHRNRLEITRRYFPAALWSVRLALVVSLLRRARRGQWDRVRLLLDLLRPA